MIILLLLPAATICNEYRWRTDSTYPIVEEFHKYNLSGTVLAADPTSIVYSDIELLQYYSVFPSAIKLYISQKDFADYVIFTEEFTPCFDDECRQTKEDFLEAISSENNLLFSTEYNDNRYIIFKRSD
jgi:hypothetical protein